MALRRPGVRVPLGPLKSGSEFITGRAFLSDNNKPDKSSKSFASELGERGVSPTTCQRSTEIELACPSAKCRQAALVKLSSQRRDSPLQQLERLG